jgi:hypothetical protein
MVYIMVCSGYSSSSVVLRVPTKWATTDEPQPPAPGSGHHALLLTLLSPIITVGGSMSVSMVAESEEAIKKSGKMAGIRLCQGAVLCILVTTQWLITMCGGQRGLCVARMLHGADASRC